jgi:hypothetical protein
MRLFPDRDFGVFADDPGLKGLRRHQGAGDRVDEAPMTSKSR